MANIPRLTEREVIYILGLHDGGLKPLEIAIRFGRDKSTITCVLQNYSWETFTGLHSHPGPPRHTSERDDRMLVRAALANRTTVLADITNSMALTISPRTVQRRLKENGIQKHIAVVKPFLTPKHVERRLQWALEYQHWTVEDWMKVIWSDESSVEIGRDTKPRWVFRRNDERLLFFKFI
jgi:hypothetical protein